MMLFKNKWKKNATQWMTKAPQKTHTHTNSHAFNEHKFTKSKDLAIFPTIVLYFLLIYK